MNLDEVMAAWHEQDSAPRVDRAVLQQVLMQDQDRRLRMARRARVFLYGVSALMFIMAALFLAIMIDPHDDDVLSAWDYVLPVVGAAAAIVMAGAMYATRVVSAAREKDFGDSLRDQLRRRIGQLDNAATAERRLAWIIVASSLICAAAVSAAANRVNDVPYGEFHLWPFPPVLIVLFIFILWWAPRQARRENAARKDQLEALLNELDSE